MKIHTKISDTIATKGAAYFVLIDPDKIDNDKFPEFLAFCSKAGVDAFLVGGSLLVAGDLEKTIRQIKEHSQIPVIIFPGAVEQVTAEADALLYISLISGRNPEHLFGKHVLAAPLIKRTGLEPLSTGYMIVESGRRTTAEYMSGSNPIPRHKPEIAAATALAAEYMGMKYVYLEGGSGADNSVPDEMVKLVADTCSIPVIVGGGIRSAHDIRNKIKSGAKIIVTGNYLENPNNWSLIQEFAEAVHSRGNIDL
ncbi:MAG: geranylgeranylglyceryl/heptaprenylglyceryl phosphate synthase [Melioribacteraceae bacterium]|nr:MAG: geranylgeranylglyceryl/heptaprenylglyceryl phosphate synthase [Melioribacteraceae bacterium]